MIVYNEIEPYCVEWLRNLVAAGELPAGHVDERSIVDLQPADCGPVFHTFAGIGGWPLALRMAGWPDDQPVFTGSCPCQPFSNAGRRDGFNDERHLWPEWFRLIRECRPPVVFGEQVDSPLGRAWLDAVFVDLEGADYACGAAVLPAAGVGAPHGRHRIYFCAFLLDHANGHGSARDMGTTEGASSQSGVEWALHRGFAGHAGAIDIVAHAGQVGGRWWAGEFGPDGVAQTERSEETVLDQRRGTPSRMAHGAGGELARVGQQFERQLESGRSGAIGGMADAASLGREQHQQQPGSDPEADRGRPSNSARDGAGRALALGCSDESRLEGRRLLTPQSTSERACFEAGAWDDIEWLECADGKRRPTQSGLRPLAHGVPGRVGKLRAYGNAIVPPLAAAFIRAAAGAIGDAFGVRILADRTAGR